MNIRPSTFRNYIGQASTKKRLEIEIHAAKIKNQQFPHLLIGGPSGLGKTTLSKIIANEFGKTLVETTGPAIKNQKNLINRLKSLEPGGIILIDEMHKLNRDIQEYLLVVLEDFEIDEEVEIDGVKTLKKTKLQPFTMIGASTRVSEIDSALRNRFERETLEPYNVAEICEIVRRYLINEGLDARDDAAIIAIAQRSRSTPRLAISLARGIVAYALYNQTNFISWSLVDEYFSSVNKIDMHGLTEIDRRMLSALLDGPLSLKRWASRVGEQSSEIEEIYEPYYVRLDLVSLDSKGRAPTEKLFQLFNKPCPKWVPVSKSHVEVAELN